MLAITTCVGWYQALAQESIEVKRFERLESINQIEIQTLRRERLDLDTGMFVPLENQVIIQPESETGLFRLLVGANPANMRISLNAEIFQEMPGVPDSPRYRDPKYDPIKEAFTIDCKNAASNYTSQVSKLLGAPVGVNESFSQRLMLARASSIAPKYEKACLSPLQDTPVEIQRVVGVFSVNGEPYCSGTIVDQNTIITAKHCFYDSVTGNGSDMNAAWGAGNLTFHTPVKHGRQNLFTVKKPSSIIQRVNPFGATDDQMAVQIYKNFSYVASISATPIDSSFYPITGWIVGSNVNLSDFSQPRSITDYIRGSKPAACALLERTDSGCLYHTCQTSKSTSGAGFFMKTANGYQLIATHKGTSAGAVGCEQSPPSDLKMNLAVSIN